MDQGVKEKFMELRAQGMPYVKIAAQIGVSKTTLIDWSKKYRSEIARLKSSEVDVMCEQFRIACRHRVERLVKQLDRVEAELATRDFSDLKTAELLRALTRLLQSVRTEVEPLQVSLDVDSPMARYLEIIRTVATVAKVAP